MTMKPKPGNRPDANDMATPFEKDADAASAPPTHPNREEEEEEAARLGDFA